MNLPTVTGVREFTKTKLAELLQNKMSQRMKRMVFFTSLTAKLRDTRDLDTETIHALNTTMGLVTRESSLMLPAMFAKGIWDSVPNFDQIKAMFTLPEWTKEKIQELCSLVYQYIPAWLRYADQDVMESDFELMFQNRASIIGV